MKKNLTILLVLFLFAGIILFTGFVFPILIRAYLYQPYVKSILLFVIFTIVVIRGRFTWNNYVMIPIAIFTILGTFMDSAGNPIYNKPLEWLFSSIGQLQIDTNVYNYAPGEYSITDHLSVLKSDGQVVQVHTVFLYLYRFFQYLFFYSAVSTLFGTLIKLLPDHKVIPPLKKEEEVSVEIKQKIEEEIKRREEVTKRRITLSNEVMQSVLELKRENQIIKAIKLVRDHTDLSLSEAKALVESLEDWNKI